MLTIADDRILITSRTEAGRILSSPSKREGIKYLISIGTGTELPPAGFRNVQRRLRLLFEDELTPELGGPTHHDVHGLILFARRIELSSGRLLVHCQAGVSRSAAAAVIVLATTLGPGYEGDIAAFLRRVYPHCRPNRLMLKLADEILKTDGLLERVWATPSE